MINILATYRGEKSSHKLIELPPGFFDLADLAIHEMQSEATEGDMEKELMQQEIKSSCRSLEMLSDLRLKKILKGAIADAYREKPEHEKDAFTFKERKLYDNIVMGIREIKGRKV